MERSTARQRQILLVLLTSLVELVLFIWGRACNVTAAAAAAAARGSAPTHPHTHITCNNPLTPRHIYRECRERDVLTLGGGVHADALRSQAELALATCLPAAYEQNALQKGKPK